MLANLDPLILARMQFGFTVAFHIVFPAFSIGLASFYHDTKSDASMRLSAVATSDTAVAPALARMRKKRI